MLSFSRRAVSMASAISALAFGLPAFAQQSTVLQTLWEVRVGAGDYTTVGTTAERDAYVNRGAFIYVPKTNISGTLPWYRLFNGVDHMSSTVPGEGGYPTEGVLGYPWSSATAVPGLGKPWRIYNATGDHAEVRAGDTIAGYNSIDAPNIFGYLRHHNTAEVLNTLSAGGVTISSNNVAGAAIWSWVWNGVEFVDHADYGREIQSAVFWRENGVIRKPTEAGAEFSGGAIAGNNQGSPTYVSSNSGSTQTTRAIPLEWEPDLWGGNNTINPVIYADMQLGKDITLNWNGMGPVAKYVTHVITSSAISDATVETPTGYMPSTFNRFYTYDASSQTLTEVFPGTNCIAGYLAYVPASGHGGVIISNSTQTRAMAVSGTMSGAGGALQRFNMVDCRASSSTVKWSVFKEGVSIPAGDNTFPTFIATGSVTDVVSNMRTLFLNGDI